MKNEVISALRTTEPTREVIPLRNNFVTRYDTFIHSILAEVMENLQLCGLSRLHITLEIDSGRG